MIEKKVSLYRFYESYAMAEVEAKQFANDDTVLAGNPPKPAQWKVHVHVSRVVLTRGKTAIDPVEMELVLEITGAEKDIDRWAQEFRALHDNRGLSRRQEAEEFQKKLTEAQQQKKAAQG